MVVFFVSYDYLDKVVSHFKKNNFLAQLNERKMVIWITLTVISMAIIRFMNLFIKRFSMSQNCLVIVTKSSAIIRKQ